MYPLDEVFKDELLSKLIFQKHDYCSVHGLSPTHFRKLYRAGGGYDFQALFLTSRWHGVSWAQCLVPQDRKEWIEAALGGSVQSIVVGIKRKFETCEKYKLVPLTEVDHVDPEFSETVRDVMSQNGFVEAFSGFDWWSEKLFELPEQNPALHYPRAAHKTAQCKQSVKTAIWEVPEIESLPVVLQLTYGQGGCTDIRSVCTGTV